MKTLTIAAAGIIALALLTLPAGAEVVWTFFETSCTAAGGADCTYQPAGGLAQLVLPDIDSAGSWSAFYSHATAEVTETGDTDFSFRLIDPKSLPFAAPGFHPAGPDIIADIAYNIAFASSPSGPSISENYTAAFNDFCFTGGVAPPGLCNLSGGGDLLVATDSEFLLGCSIFLGTCHITGSWLLTTVPEPSSVSTVVLLVVGSLASLLTSARHRKSRRAPLRAMANPIHSQFAWRICARMRNRRLLRSVTLVN